MIMLREGYSLKPGNSKKLALDAIRRAMDLRRQLKVDLLSPVCVYDAVQNLHIEVRFAEIPSMEAMYSKGNPATIVVSSMRPAGRQVFNTTHELGHHVFGHGTCIDDLLDQDLPSNTPEEFLANSFAGAFLMPKSAVGHAFTRRNWRPATCTPEQAFTIAGWFGVGYTTLIHHMSRVLEILPRLHADELKKIPPKQIRAGILGHEIEEDLVIVDNNWDGRIKAIDIQVGDIICLPPQIVNEKVHEQHCVGRYNEDGQRTLLIGERPGIGRLIHPETGWAAFVRVSRRGYVGRSLYRHLEDADDE